MSQTKAQLVEGLNINTSAPAGALVINSSGTVGIGASSTAQLHVQQSAVTSAPARVAALYLENNANCEIQFVGNASNDCQLRFGTTSNSFKGALEYELDNNNLKAYTNGSERLRITSDGKLGLGTASPSQLLHLSSSGPRILLTQTSANSNAFLDAATSGVLEFSADDNNVAASSSMRFKVDGTERIRIDSSGNVGINQVPTRELSLHSPNNNNALIHFTNDDTGETSGDGILVGLDGNENMVINNQETGKTINFYNGGSERLRIDSSGRLLVGTTTEGHADAANLTVADTSDCGITIRSGASNFGSIYFSDATSGNAEHAGYIDYSHSNNSMRIGTNESTRLSIDSSGRLLLGASSSRGANFNNGSGVDSQFLLEGTSFVTSFANIVRNSNDANCAGFALSKSRGASAGSNTIVQGNDKLGEIAFQGSDGSKMVSAAAILGECDGTPGSSDMPGRLVFKTTADGASSSTERMRIGRSGQLHLGTSSDKTQSGCKFVVQGSGSAVAEVYNSAGSYITWSSGSTATARGFVGTANQLVTGGSGDDLAVRAENHLTFATNGSNERMRISSGGSLFINRTSAVNAEKFSVGNDGQVAYFRCTVNANHSNIQMSHSYATGGQTASQISFQNASLTEVGTIKSTASSTSFNTSSDYRLKENVVDIADGITRVKQLLPKRFNFIVNADKTVDGFIAHEAQVVVPEAVTGEKDGKEMQGIDQSKLVPLLTAALQEAITKIETLETKVAALEAG